MMTMETRKAFAGRVVRNFDKFVQYSNPVPINPIEDIYRLAYSDKEWAALRFLLSTKSGAVATSSSFDLFFTGSTNTGPHITFRFPHTAMPNCGIHVNDLPPLVMRKVRAWIAGVNYMRSLKRELRARCEGLMGNPNKGNQERRISDLDPKCNTPGQVLRIWPELQPFFPADLKDSVRIALVRSRLPKHVGWVITRPDGTDGFATSDEFRCRHRDCHSDEKRRFEEISEILRRLSLATDVKEIDDYPTFHGKAI